MVTTKIIENSRTVSSGSKDHVCPQGTFTIQIKDCMHNKSSPRTLMSTNSIENKIFSPLAQEARRKSNQDEITVPVYRIRSARPRDMRGPRTLYSSNRAFINRETRSETSIHQAQRPYSIIRKNTIRRIKI